MKRYLHWYIIFVFLLVLSYDFIVWGAASRLPEIGPSLLHSAQREGPLAYFYMRVGGIIDENVPALDKWGQQHASNALGEGASRIKDDPAVTMDLVFSNTWNNQHALLKFCHWGAPALAVLSLVFWLRRPKKVSLMGARRR
jgi:hypothetical protein